MDGEAVWRLANVVLDDVARKTHPFGVTAHIGAVRRRMLHHPGQGALHLIGQHTELAVAVGDR